MRHRPSRLFTTTAMLGASLLLSGGVLLATAGSASAAAGGLETCTSLTASIDLLTLTATGTISGCNSAGLNPGNITIGPLDLSGGPSPGSIFWAAGKATSLTTTSADITMGPDCSAIAASTGDPQLPITLTITVLAGPFAGTTGGGGACVDLVTFTLVNVGPITL
jgi:hypothetical protein